MNQSVELSANPLAMSSMITSVVYFVLVASASLAWYTGCAYTPLTAVDVEEHTPLNSSSFRKRKSKMRYTRSKITTGANYMINSCCPAEPNCARSKCTSYSSMCFIFRVILFFTSWGLFIGSALNEYPSFTFAQIWNTLPRNFAMMWAFLFTTAGGLLDIVALMITCYNSDSPYERACSLKCPFRRPDNV